MPAIIDAATSTVTLPVEPGTDLTLARPDVRRRADVHGHARRAGGLPPPRDRDGHRRRTARPGPGRCGRSRCARPCCPGFYADPNIAVFDDTYYIYATTDGFAGWGGKEFYVWKSKNLVDWTRSDEPFLTLDGANGNVPWATGNAWAPTIIERDGKYYFYFSGHNAALNRKTIGVAVADSPEGPFTASRRR